MRKIMAMGLAALAALTLAGTGLAEAAPTPLQRTETIELEGMPEQFTATQYLHEGLFSVWYDAQKFVPAQTRDGVLFILADNRLDRPVSVEITAVVDHAEYGALTLEVERRLAQAQGFTVGELDTEGMFPLVAGEDVTVTGFRGVKEGDLLYVYLLSYGERDVLVTLRYPLEAAEGWGARIQYMVNTLEVVRP